MVFGNKKKQAPYISPANYFLSLGAGRNQLGLIEAAQKLGYQVIAVDRNKTAPGFEKADLRMYCSILRPKTIVKNLYPNLVNGELVGVGCRSFGKANFCAALIADHFSLPGPEPKKMGVFQNKTRLKKLLNNLEIPTAPSYAFKKTVPNSIKTVFTQWPKYLPLIARPVMGHAKQGVRFLERVEDISHFLEQNLHTENYLLDKYIEGKEVTVLGFVDKGRFQLVCIIDKYVGKYPPGFIELQHSYPVNIDPGIEEKICDYMQRICNATHLSCSPLVAEFLICENDEKVALYLIECSPETGGEYLAEQLIPAALGMDYFQDIVRIYTGEGVTSGLSGYGRPQAQVIIRFIPQSDGLLRRLDFPARLWQHKGLLFAYYLKNAGNFTAVSRGNLDRLAVFGLQGPLKDQRLHKEVEKIAQDTKIEYSRP